MPYKYSEIRMLVRQLANHLRLACSVSAKDYKPHYIPCPPFYRDEPLNIPKTKA